MTRAALLLALTALVAAGCGELAFERDERLRFISPPERARIALPAAIEWRIAPSDFRPTRFDGGRDPHRGAFGVFVDRSPMPPGQDVDSLAARDRICATSPGCPDRTWLADHGVYLTTRRAIALPALPARGGRRAGDWRRHEVTVVLLDGRGVRIGEGAWSRSFYTRARGTP